MSIILWKHFLLHNYQTYLSNEGRVPDEVTCYNVLDVFWGQQIQKAVSTGVKDIIKDNENNNKNNNDRWGNN